MKIVSIVLLMLCALTYGCASFRGERDAYARTAYHVADSVKELSEVTPPTDPRKPGIEILRVETKAVAESLPAPSAQDRMEPIPFVRAVEAAESAKALAVEAGRSDDEAQVLGVQAAMAIVADQPQAIDNAIQKYRAAAADASMGIMGSIGQGVMSVLNLFGPVGGVATGLLGLVFGLFSSWKKRRVQEGLVKTVQGIDDAVDAVKSAYKENGAIGLTSDEVKSALYSALENAHETMKDAEQFMADVKQIKAQYRAK